ncbi:ABC transporter permease [Microbacterium sp. 22242]|uniref:ABC transporter permease n=1 Tax=Microbacterium sp. 22242 TaxID=3453896 RepID=UPI003F82FADD
MLTDTSTISQDALRTQERLLRGSELRPERGANPLTRFFVVVALFPVVGIVGLLLVILSLGFRENGIPSGAITTRNYAALVSDPALLQVVLNTVVYVAVTVAIAVVLGTVLALIVERTDFGLARTTGGLILLRVLIPSFFTAMGWLFLLHPRIGAVNVWLKNAFGLDHAVLDVTTVVGMGFVEGLSLSGLVYMMVSASLRNMDGSLEESARTAGASAFTVVRRITLPLVTPALLSSFMFVSTIALSALDVPLVLGLSNRTLVFSSFLYLQANPAAGISDYGVSTAFSSILIVLAIALSLWYMRVLRSGGKYRVLTGKGHRPVRNRLGTGARIAAWVYVVGYFLLSMVLPLLMVVWASLLRYLQPPSLEALKNVTFDNYTQLNWDNLLRGFGNSIEISLVAPTLAVGFSIAISFLLIRSRLRSRFAFDLAAFFPQAVPTTIFALGAVVVAIYFFRGWLYGSAVLIAIVMALVQIPLANRNLSAALLQIHPELEEAARMSGATAWQVMRRVTLPLLMPTVLSSWLWIALLAMRDLTVPALLASPESAPLALVSWSLFQGGAMGSASAVTLIMILVMSPIVAIYLFLTRKNERPGA